MGLVSIWAAEGTSGEKPNDSKEKLEKKLDSKWNKPITLTSKLESQWASSGDGQKDNSRAHVGGGRQEKSSFNHGGGGRSHVKRTGGRPHETNFHQDKDHRKRHPNKRGNKHTIHEKPATDQEVHQAPGVRHVEESDVETVVSDKLYAKGPTTKAAQSLASRITIDPRREEADADDATVWEEEEVEEQTQQRFKQKPTRGKSLAERLDSMSFKDAKHKIPEASSPRAKNRKSTNKDIRKQPANLLTRGSGHFSKKLDSIDEQAAKEKEEKEKQELLKMLEEFESKKIDWASLED